MKKKATKQALLMSVMSLLLCVSMLVGTTFAWFTDSVTSANNIIKSGNLDVEMYWAEGTEDPNSANWKDASQGAIFDYDNWEPGYVQVRHIKIANKGTLALKYKVSILANGTVEDLSDVIDVYYMDPAVQVTDRAALANAPKLGTLTEVLAALGETGNGELEAGKSDTITLAFKMQESAGNEYQDKAIGADFSVVLNATQLTYEKDSFDDQYDANTANPTYSALVPLPESGSMIIGEDDFVTTVPETLVDVLRKELDSEESKDYIPNLSLMLAGRKDDAQNSIISFETVEIVEIVDENVNIIDLEATNNTIPITVKVNVGDTFVEGSIVTVYHDGELVTTATVDEDGYITYEVCHFCRVEIVDSFKAAYLKDDQICWEVCPKDPNKDYPSNYEALIAGKSTSANYVLTGSVNVTDKIYFGDNTENTIDLNGQNVATTSGYVFATQGANCKLTVYGIGTVETSTGYAAFANKNSTLTINGGTFNLGNTNEKAHFFTQNSATTIINGGTFISEDPNTPIVYCINGFVEIKGGFFQNTANPNQELLSMGNNLKYADNQKITLSGGTFVNWNPMDSAFARAWTNPDVPAMIVLAAGYQMFSEPQANGDIWYTVVPVTSGN